MTSEVQRLKDQAERAEAERRDLLKKIEELERRTERQNEQDRRDRDRRASRDRNADEQVTPDICKVLKAARLMRKLDGSRRNVNSWSEFASDLRTVSLSFPSLKQCLDHLDSHEPDGVESPVRSAPDKILFALLQASTTALAHQIVTGFDRSSTADHPPSGIEALRQLRDTVLPSTLGDYYGALHAVTDPPIVISSRNDPRSTLLTYAANLRSMEHQFDVKIHEDIAVATVLRKLPAEYDALRSEMLARSTRGTRLTLDGIVERVVQHWSGVIQHSTNDAARITHELPRMNMNKSHLQAIQRRDERAALDPPSQDARQHHDRGGGSGGYRGGRAPPRGEPPRMLNNDNGRGCTNCLRITGRTITGHGSKDCWRKERASAAAATFGDDERGEDRNHTAGAVRHAVLATRLVPMDVSDHPSVAALAALDDNPTVIYKATADAPFGSITTIQAGMDLLVDDIAETKAGIATLLEGTIAFTSKTDDTALLMASVIDNALTAKNVKKVCQKAVKEGLDVMKDELLDEIKDFLHTELKANLLSCFKSKSLADTIFKNAYDAVEQHLEDLAVKKKEESTAKAADTRAKKREKVAAAAEESETAHVDTAAAAATVSTPTGTPPNGNIKIIIDSGATIHVFTKESHFETLTLGSSRRLQVVGGESTPVSGSGTVRLLVTLADGSETVMLLNDVQFVPQSPFNLISVGLAEEKGVHCNFRERTLTDEDGQVLATMRKTANEYTLEDAKIVTSMRALAFTPRKSTRLAAKLTPRVVPAAATRPPKAAAAPRSPLGPRDDVTDRMLVDSHFSAIQQLTQEVFTCELFASKTNAHLQKYYTLSDDAFNHVWIHGSFFGNPPFIEALIVAAITKAVKDWERSPGTTSFTFILPEWVNASWHASRFPPMAVFTNVHTFPTGTKLFSKPGDTADAPRVLLPGTLWPVTLWHLPASAHVVTSVATDVLAHMRFGHHGGAILSNIISSNARTGLQFGAGSHRVALEVARRCYTCNIAKGFKPPHTSHVRERNTTPFALASIDFMGPFSAAADGSRYVLAIRDDCTRYTVAVTVPNRKNAGASLQALIDKMRLLVSTNLRDASGAIRSPLVGCLQSDCAAEFIGGSFPETCVTLGTTQRFTAPYVHPNNSLIERKWRDLQACSRALLHHAGLGSNMWAHALHHAVYLSNRMPTAKGDPSPYFALTKTEPDLSIVRVWGCPAILHLVYEQREQLAGETLSSGTKARKLANRGRELIYVGNAENSLNVHLVSLSAPAKIVVTGLVSRYDEDAITGRRYQAASDEKARTHADFDNIAPDTPMLTTRVTGNFVIHEHRTMRELQHDGSDYSNAIFLVSTMDKPGGVWTRAENLVEHSPIGYGIVQRYLSHALQHGNPHYPVFELANYLEETADTEPTACIVIGTDNACKDGLDIRIAEQSANEGANVMDVPRAKLSTQMPSHVEENLPGDNLATALAATSIEGCDTQTVTEPRNIRQALRGPDKVQWMETVEREISTLEDKGTWVEVDCVPPGRTAIMSAVKLKVKWNADGTLDKRKARLVAFGMHQQFGVDYTETWAPSSQLTSVHLFLCVCVQLDLTAYHADAVSAFVNAKLKETIYLTLPPEVNRPYRIVRLLRSLYGLKQGAHDWREASDAVMMSIDGMRRSTKETCWYYLYKGDLVAHVLVHVDDYLIGCNQPEWKAWFVEFFGGTYELNDLGPLKQIVGMGATQTEGRITLNRTHQIKQTIARFGLSDANPVKLPLAAGPFKMEMPAENDPTLPFLQGIGELRYHASSARPDLHTAICVVGKFSAKHTKEHFHALKNIMLYLKDTIDVPLIFTAGLFGPDGCIRIELFTDSAHNSCSITGRSMSGWVVAVNDQPVLWHAERQSLVTLSSTHAEVVACSDGIKDLLYVKDILSEFHKVHYPMIVHQDNMATIQMFKNAVNNGTTKYIDVKYFWTREHIDNGTIKLQHIKGTVNPADFLTKPLGGEAFHKGRTKLLGHTDINGRAHDWREAKDAAVVTIGGVTKYAPKIEPSPYGLKQSARKWSGGNRDPYLRRYGTKQSTRKWGTIGAQDRAHAEDDLTNRVPRDRELAAATTW